MVEELGLKECKAVGTPGEDEKKHEMEGNDEEEDKEGARKFRSLAARANYLAADRLDIQYSVKEVCRGMAKPSKGGMRKLKRIGRYLKGRPRVVWKFEWQDEQNEVTVCTDSDWAGCLRTRKSTSGGVVRIGAHIIKAWRKDGGGIRIEGMQGCRNSRRRREEA
jgi:hypothetical protein